MNTSICFSFDSVIPHCGVFYYYPYVHGPKPRFLSQQYGPPKAATLIINVCPHWKIRVCIQFMLLSLRNIQSC